jgi:peroxiredoxin
VSRAEIRPPLGPRLLGGALILSALGGALWFGQAVLRAALAPTELGRPAPGFAEEALSGAPVRLADLRGKVVLLDFWSVRCVGCIGATPKHNALARAYGPEGLVVLGVNQDPEEVERVKTYAEDRPVEFPTVVDDGAIADAFGITVLPAVVLIDAEGMIRARHVGAVTQQQLVRDVERLLAEAERSSDGAAMAASAR